MYISPYIPKAKKAGRDETIYLDINVVCHVTILAGLLDFLLLYVESEV